MRPVYKKGAFFALIIIAGAAIYANSLRGEFLWDDHLLVKDNVYTKSFSHLPAIFTQDHGRGAGVRYNFYRPLQILSYALEHPLWKSDPGGYHLVNIILHILVALCVFWFVELAFGDVRLAFLASIFFTVHPVHTETVSYISNRGDLLSVLFMLLCLIFYVSFLGRRARSFYLLALLSFVLALLTKENSLIIPALILAYHFVFKKKLSPARFFPLIGLLAVYVIFRVVFVRSSITEAGAILSFLKRLPAFFAAIATYLRLLFLPFGLHAEYGKPLFGWTHPFVILGVVITSGLLIYAFKIRSRNGLVSFSVIWFFICLLPFSNIYPLPFYMAEHYLYLASLGFFLILAKAAILTYGFKRFRTLALLFFIGLGFLYSGLTVKQTGYWLDPLTFYTRTLEYEPDNARIYHNLGDTYNLREDYERAIAAYKKSLELEPYQADTYTNLALVYAVMEKVDKAVSLYQKALLIDPEYTPAHNNLGAVYYALAKREEALASYRKAIELNPLYVKPYINLGLAYYDSKEYEQAVAYYKKALKIDPSSATAHNNLCVAYTDSGRFKQALSECETAVRLKPDYADAYHNLGLVYVYLGKKEKASDMFKKAIEVDPGHVDALYNLGILYKNSGRPKEAIKFLEKVITILPQADAYNALGSVYRNAGRTEEALKMFKKAIEIEPRYVKAYYNAAVIYFNQGEFALAIRYCDEGLKHGDIDSDFLKALEPHREK
jgi:tetratricopeptide (TPR) repeat protein